MPYQLLAADMDGTLLNSRKEISPEDAAAITRALEEGKQVVFSTGRCIGELEPFLALFPAMRYVLCESGACVYDRAENRVLHLQTIDPQAAKTILDYTKDRDIMPQVLVHNQAVMDIRHLSDLSHYKMAHYQDHFRQNCRSTNDIYRYCQAQNWTFEKICLYHTSPEDRADTLLAVEGLPLSTALAEKTSLEISAQGVDKGVGLEILCRHLGLPLEETIVVGDSFNDLPILKRAGLPVAVDNAAEPVKAACRAVVADCDHSGVSQAIQRYLLG
ncbi:MAG: Cof-type HAD-IIB family hydrolase [Clostridiales bacterium]|nr:Cof-type HAD-IIB family hydrolase [Clostridiales bacterium]